MSPQSWVPLGANVPQSFGLEGRSATEFRNGMALTQDGFRGSSRQEGGLMMMIMMMVV